MNETRNGSPRTEAEPCGYLLGHVNVPERGPGPSPCALPKGHDGWHEYAPVEQEAARPLPEPQRIVVLMENEGVVQWGDEGHRQRFLEWIGVIPDRPEPSLEDRIGAAFNDVAAPTITDRTRMCPDPSAHADRPEPSLNVERLRGAIDNHVSMECGYDACFGECAPKIAAEYARLSQPPAPATAHEVKR